MNIKRCKQDYGAGQAPYNNCAAGRDGALNSSPRTGTNHFGYLGRGCSTGQAALSMVFIIGSIIVFAAISLAFLVVTFINSSTGYQASNRALAVANAGVNDAMLRITRDVTYYASSTYSMPIDSYTANVSITTSTASTIIVSSASVSGYTRTIRATVSVSTSTGELGAVFWEFQ